MFRCKIALLLAILFISSVLYGIDPEDRLRVEPSDQSHLTGTHSSSWLEGWSYRKAIRVTSNSGSALSDYQIPVDITTSIYDNTGLVGSWHFNEGSGSAVSDASGNGNNGIYSGSGSHWTTEGKFGNGGTFNGSNDYVWVSNSTSLNITSNSITVSAWIKHSTSPWHSICDGIVQHEGQYALQINNGQPTFYVNTGAGWVSARWTNTLSLDIWYHITGVYDGFSVKMWVDGIERASTNNTGNLASSTSAIFLGSATGGAYSFNGTIDEVRIYNRALSPNEIQLHYTANKARLDYADIRFTDNDGTTLLDYWMESDKKF